MIDEKPWYQSKSIWGSLVALLALVASLFGIEADAETQGALTDGIVQIVGVAGTLFAIFGRVVAKAEIS